MLKGRVIRGEGIGTRLGFRTANLDVKKEDLQVDQGVYAAWAKLQDKKYKAALVVRIEPFKVEVFLLDYEGGDIYGEELVVEPLQEVSKVRVFERQEELREKIKEDLELAEKVFRKFT